jgi:hypothetical protein
MPRSRAPSKLKPLLRLLAAAVAVSAGQAATAAEIAPYFHTWDGTLMAARQASGLSSALLSFAITHGTCALDPTLPDMLGDARNFTAAGGKLMISFGGTGGVYVETACTDDEAFTVMEKLMLDSGIRRFDFDIEGAHVQDTASNARRARVLARLQAKYPDLEVTISLPGWLYGFSQAGVDLLKTTMATGVRVDRVIVMAQSFGIDNIKSMVSPATVGQAVIMTFKAGAQQVAPLFPNKSQSQLYAMMGVTSMIGTNDDGSTFTLADASTLTDFVKNNGIGLLSWWSFQRDRAQSYSGASDINTYSGVAQSAWQFFYTFKNADGAVSGSPAPAAAAGGSCNASPWVQGKAYQAGSVVSYGGKQYTAKMWTAAVPTPNGNGWSDWSSSSCSGSPAPAAAAPSGSCNIVGWVKGKPYPAGSIVSYGGQLYSAKMWNAGSIPTPNAYGWTDWNPYVCN